MTSPIEMDEFRLEALEGEINLLEERLTRDDQEIGFCHNDLQYGNIMIDEETNAITIIVSFYMNRNFPSPSRKSSVFHQFNVYQFLIAGL